jgi:hypothetical protein
MKLIQNIIMIHLIEHEDSQSLVNLDNCIPNGFEAIDNELGMMLGHLEDMLVGIIPLEDLDGYQDWCSRPRNSNYPEILGIDFSKHLVAIECLATIDRIRNAI